jgi:guanylate kinase
VSDGFLLVISAPSGCGKTTILRQVMAEMPGVTFSVSHTTRAPREGEVDGKDYFFVSRKEFERIRDGKPGGFLEWAEVHGNYYGTGNEQVVRQLESGQDVVLDIDVQGAQQVMENGDPVTVFIAPPNLEELTRRLRGRGTDSEETIRLRLSNAEQEMALSGRYDYLIVNDRLEEAVGSLQAIIMAERLRRRRRVSGSVFSP